jgi:hypothetical protein
MLCSSRFTVFHEFVIAYCMYFLYVCSSAVPVISLLAVVSADYGVKNYGVDAAFTLSSPRFCYVVWHVNAVLREMN